MTKILLALAFVITWSSGFVGATLAGRAAPPATLLSWRYGTAAAILLLVCALGPGRRELRTTSPHDIARQVALGLLAHVLFLGGVFTAAAAGLNAGLSALVCAAQPMLVAAAGRWWFGDHLNRVQVVGLAAGLSGVALSVGSLGTAGAGNAWMAVLALIALSVSALLERRWQPTVSLTLSMTIQTAVAACAFGAWALFTTRLQTQVSQTFALAVAWLVLLSGFGGYATFTACLRRLGATSTSTLLYLTPPVTMLWAWGMFGEAPTALQVVGLCVVLAGVGMTFASHPGLRATDGAQ